MNRSLTLNVAMNWKPPRGLERIHTCVDGLRVRIAEEEEEFIELLQDAEVACGGGFDARTLEAAPKLRWIQFFSGGVQLDPALVESPIPITCLKGCFDIPAAEFAIAGMLALARKLAYDMRQRPLRTFTEMEPEDIHGKTVGIIGLGSMGREIARRCRGFGMQVLGVKRQPGPCPPEVDALMGSDQLGEVLSAVDFVVVAVPFTQQTEGLIGRQELGCMKPSACLIDVSGRPGIYDLEALSDSLRSGRIAGAHLQIVPDDASPLWDLDNLILSFHRVVSRQSFDLAIERFCENIRRYREGQPLLGLVDKEAGY